MNDYTTHKDFRDNAVRRDHNPEKPDGALAGAVVAVLMLGSVAVALAVAIVGHVVTR